MKARPKKKLPDRESNPGLPRDRRRYLPRGPNYKQPVLRKAIDMDQTFKMKARPKKKLPDRESNPGLPRDRRRYLPLYYRGPHYKQTVNAEQCYRRGPNFLKWRLVQKRSSPTGNRTRVFCVTGGDTYHYTIEDQITSNQCWETL